MLPPVLWLLPAACSQGLQDLQPLPPWRPHLLPPPNLTMEALCWDSVPRSPQFRFLCSCPTFLKPGSPTPSDSSLAWFPSLHPPPSLHIQHRPEVSALRCSQSPKQPSRPHCFSRRGPGILVIRSAPGSFTSLPLCSESVAPRLTPFRILVFTCARWERRRPSHHPSSHCDLEQVPLLL